MGDKKWYALYTRSRAEKKALRDLEDLGVEVFLPIVRKYRKWSDRVKAVDMPLLSSYIFVCVSETDYYTALNVRDVVCYVTFEGKAVPIQEKEINNLKLICGSKLSEDVTVESFEFEKGEQIKINQGDFKGFEGEVIHSNSSSKLVVRLQHLNCSIAVQLKAFMVDKVSH